MKKENLVICYKINFSSFLAKQYWVKLFLKIYSDNKKTADFISAAVFIIKKD